MEHADHVALIQNGVTGRNWADLGSGRGAFTLALAECLGDEGVIYSVDVDRRGLDAQKVKFQAEFPSVSVHYWQRDFTHRLDLPPLDGILMANSLHFIRDKVPFLRQLYDYLKPGGTFLLVEYDSDQGNPYVPYPLSYNTWAKLSAEAGFTGTQQLHRVPSRFLDHMYSAVSHRP